jgi:very-short-patch-repair endonuclease
VEGGGVNGFPDRAAIVRRFVGRDAAPTPEQRAAADEAWCRVQLLTNTGWKMRAWHPTSPGSPCTVKLDGYPGARDWDHQMIAGWMDHAYRLIAPDGRAVFVSTGWTGTRSCGSPTCTATGGGWRSGPKSRCTTPVAPWRSGFAKRGAPVTDAPTPRPAASPDAPGTHPSAIVRGEGRGTRGKTHEGAQTITEAKRAIRKAERERHETALANVLHQAGLPEPKWTADFCYPAARLLIEVQGGVWSGGRHTRGAGYERDRVKYFEAQLRGWRVIEVTPAMIADGRALSLIERALKGAD